MALSSGQSTFRFPDLEQPTCAHAFMIDGIDLHAARMWTLPSIKHRDAPPC